jgi:hypothetical protein
MSKTSRGRAKTPTVSRRPFTLLLFRRDDQKSSSSPLTSGVPEITSTDGRFATEDSAAAIRACRLQSPLVDRVVELRGRLETRNCDNDAETCNQRTDAAKPLTDRSVARRPKARTKALAGAADPRTFWQRSARRCEPVVSERSGPCAQRLTPLDELRAHQPRSRIEAIREPERLDALGPLLVTQMGSGLRTRGLRRFPFSPHAFHARRSHYLARV